MQLNETDCSTLGPVVGSRRGTGTAVMGLLGTMSARTKEICIFHPVRVERTRPRGCGVQARHYHPVGLTFGEVTARNLFKVDLSGQAVAVRRAGITLEQIV